MDRLLQLVGCEHEFATGTRALKYFAHEIGAPVAGALLVTCADGLEHECADAFSRGFADEVLPRLPNGSRAPLRVASFGGQYPWGAIRIAERQFATERTRSAFKLIVVKVNAHVFAGGAHGERTYGRFERYGAESSACGALNALVTGQRLPFLNELESEFRSEGVDRIAALQDRDQNLALLFAAVCAARLQARRAILDIQDYRDSTPTYWTVIPCVSINRSSRSTEFWCGVYKFDRRVAGGIALYAGLGDDPSRYELQSKLSPLRMTDGAPFEERDARDHRALVRAALHRGESGPIHHDSVREIRQRFAQSQQQGHAPGYAKAALKMLVKGLAQTNPITTAALLFSEGVVEIQHAHRAHHLAQSADDPAAAHDIVRDTLARFDSLPPEQAQALLETLLDPGNGFVAVK